MTDPYEIPAGVRMPADHLPASQMTPIREEAEGSGMMEMKGHGLTFSVPADPQDWPAAAIIAAEEGKAVSVVRELLGPNVFDSHGMGRWPLRDLKDMFDRVAAAVGLQSAGN